MSSLTVQDLNALNRDAFVAVVGHVFEHSPWIAEGTWPRRPFRDVAHLHLELCRTMRMASQERQQALLHSHPDLAGRLAPQRKLTAASTEEQAAAGLTALTQAELAMFQELNQSYRARFGFPFIICARLNAKDAILQAMRRRVTNPPEVEFQSALDEIEKIALLRLQDVLAP
jgi:2-oxo-4-hydroxy-4-carboxy-5-ureidoimidazoline decarboxylase